MSGINAGDSGCTTGLSGRLYSDWTGDTANNGFSGALSAGQQTLLKSQCWQWAQAIRDQLIAEAVFAEYYCSSAQSIPNSALTTVNMDTKVTDTDNAVTTGAAWVFTVPAGKGGLYSVMTELSLNSASATGRTFFSLVKNAAEYRRLARFNNAVAVQSFAGAVVLPLAAGDTLAIAINQSTGSAQPLELVAGVVNWVTIARQVGY